MTFFSALKKFRFRSKKKESHEELPCALEATEAVLQEDQEVPPPLPLTSQSSRNEEYAKVDGTRQMQDCDLISRSNPSLTQHPAAFLNSAVKRDKISGLPLSQPQMLSELPPPIPSSSFPSSTLPSFLKKDWDRLPPALVNFWNSFISSNKQQQTKKIFSKIRYELSWLKKTSLQRDLLILRPGEEESQWQLWKFSNIQTEAPTLLNNNAPPLALSQKTQLLVGVPTRDLIVIPLWISTEGNIQELLELELSSKHLLRRGMMEGLKTISIETEESRTLIVVLAPTTSPSTPTAPYLKAADQFEASARLLPHHDADLLIWRELGEICFGFSRKGEYVWFSGTNETKVTQTTLGLIKRMILQLEAEAILQETPRSLHIIGSFSEEERSLLKSLVRISATSLDRQRFHYHAELPDPILSVPPLDLPDEAARSERIHQEKKLRYKRFIALIILIYLCILLLAGSTLFLKKLTLRYYQRRIAKEEQAIKQANQTILQWQEFRSAIDPTTYPLDILAEIARQIHGEKIRLITLTGIEGRLQIIGEATDVAQAYHFIEQIKKAPALQEYEWTSGQPKLAGKSSVRFELEGSRSHAKTSTE